MLAMVHVGMSESASCGEGKEEDGAEVMTMIHERVCLPANYSKMARPQEKVDVDIRCAISVASWGGGYFIAIWGILGIKFAA